MHITFVHTPMATLTIPERCNFWRYFDVQYHSAHPGLQHMVNNLWELPHWMHWLGGVLVDAGYDSIDTLDFYSAETALAGINVARVTETVTAHPADVYLFSPMTPNLPFAYEIADVIKATFPKSIVVFGGVVATPMKEEVARYPSVDYVVYDRGEYALPALLDAIQCKRDISRVGNLTYRAPDGKVRTNVIKYPYMPVEDIPFPKIDLFPRSVGQDIRYLRQVYALGCPFKCSFCTIQTIGRKAQYFPIERCLAEIKAYRSYYGEHHNIYWGDETFTVHPELTLALCSALEEDGTIQYDCQTRLNCLTHQPVIDALARSGCRWVEVGLETAVQDSQNTYKQGVKLSTAEETLKRLQDAGIGTCSFLVNGFPTETIDDMKRTIDYVSSLLSRNLLSATYLFGLVPYPGSDMYDHPEKFSMELLHKDYKYYHEEMPPVFRSPHATPDEVYQQFLDGVKHLGQAMRKKPAFGEMPPEEELSNYGTFWTDAHV